MKSFKNLLAACLSLSLTMVSAYAASNLTVDIPPPSALYDGQYIVTVDISDNTGFSSAQLELSYDSAVLECLKVIPGEVVRGMLTDTNPNAPGEKQCAILSAAAAENSVENGRLASFVFAEPKDGNPRLELTFAELRSSDGSAVECEITVNDNFGYAENDPEPDTPSDKDTKPPRGGSGGSGGFSPGGGTSQNTVGNSDTEIKPEPETPENSENQTTALSFSDVSSDHWASRYIEKAVSLGIVKGYPDGTFLPDAEMTRAEFASVLRNMAADSDTNSDFKSELPFADVSGGDWFFDCVSWAYERGYIKGTSGTEFSPNAAVTREQAMTILYRLGGSPETAGNLDSFEDRADISDFAVSAMTWAAECGIITGTDSTHITPKGYTTRAQLSAIAVRYMNTEK